MALLSLPKFRITDETGTPYPAAKLYIYQPGSTTEIITYSDIDMLVQHANPVEADSEGLFPAIYINTTANPIVRVIAKDQNDVAIADYDIDDIQLLANAFQSATFAGPVDFSDDVEFLAGVTLDGQITISNSTPNITIIESDESSNEKVWDINIAAGVLSVRTRSDALGAGKNILVVTRGTTTALSSIAIGNATDLPAITLNGTTLVAAEIAQNVADSFVATLTGMTASTTATVQIKKTGNKITLHSGGSAITGTSNSTSMTLTGVPAAYRPAVAQTCPCLLTDNGVLVEAWAQIETSGTITFGVGAFGNFTNPGTKGFYNYTTLQWELD